MSAVYKFIGTEIDVSSANTVSLAKVVRVMNISNSLAYLAVANTTANTGNTTLGPYESIIVEKQPAETVSGTNLKAVAIAYRN